MASVSHPGADDVTELAGAFDARTRDLLDELTAGESHTTFLREATGMNRQTVHRRLDDLEERDLIETETRAPDSGGQPRRHARLTEYGEEMIEKGLLDAIHDTNKNLLALEQRITKIQSELEKKIDRQPGRADVKRTVSGELDRRIGSMERQVENLKETVEKYERWINDARKEAGKVDDRLSSRIDGVERTAEAARDDARDARRELEESLETLEERVGEIEGVAQTVEMVRDETVDRKRDLEELEERVGSLEERVGSLEERESEAGDVRGDLEELEERVGSLEERVEARLHEVGRRLSTVEQEVEDAADVEERLAALESDVDDVRENEKERGGGFF